MKRHRLARRVRVVLTICGVGMLGVGLTACGGNINLGNMFGFGKSAPNEYAVVAGAPLTIPPDFALRPPQPGLALEAQQDLFELEGVVYARPRSDQGSSGGGYTGVSRGEIALLEKAGALESNPDIRRRLIEGGPPKGEDDGSFIDSLMFWRR